MSAVQKNEEDVRTGQDLHDVPLSALGQHAMEPLYAFLNSERLFPSPHRFPRDWRGLAELVEVPGQYHSSIRNCSDHGGPTAKVISMWMKKNDGSATVGMLQEYLQNLDRWDIYDDTKELFEEEATRYRKQLKKPVPSIQNTADQRITYHDVALHPKVQRYHAYVLYAQEDAEFAHYLMGQLKDQGFMVCFEEDLLIGFTTQFEPISRLLAERCEHIILIFSPDFLESQANKFYMDYAQALGIETQTRKLVPVVYRLCNLPASYSFYHKLYYNDGQQRSMYNFWEKLSKSLEQDSELPRLTVAPEATSSQVQDALPAAAAPSLLVPASFAAPTSLPHPTLSSTPRVPTPTDTITLPDLSEINSSQDNLSTMSVQSVSQLSISTKKPNIFQKILKFKKKSKKDKAKQLVGMCAS